MTEETTVINNPALVRLVDVSENVVVQDMNYIFHYARVKKPDTNPSSFFELHYKEEQQEIWATSNNLLSEKFTVAKTEQVINQIQENLGGNISSQSHWRSGTSVKGTFTLNGFQVNVEDTPDIDIMLFKLITNIVADITVLSSSNLAFNVINGFSGNHALHLNYGVLKTIRTSVNNEDRILPINNVFILDKFTKRIIHDSHLNINIEDVTNVQRNLNEQVTLFRRLMITDEIVTEFCGKFPKKFGKKFMTMYESLPENLRSLYYVSYIWSALLDSERKVPLEIKLRSFVAEVVTELSRTPEA